MSFEPVNVHVETSVGDPVEGVLVKIYDPTGTTFYTQAVSDVNGLAAFLLETLGYTMRFYKFQVGFSQPQHFTVLEAPEVNSFTVRAEPFVMPIATDPRLCRCSGFFRDLDGSAKRYLDLHFMPEFDPLVLDDAAVITEHKHIRTDDKGYGQIDLIRGAQYVVRVESLDGAQLRCIRVPDLASANLPDMLLAVVDRVVLTPEGPYALAVGEELVLTPEVYDSAGVKLEGSAVDDVNWRSSDTNILLVSPTQSTVVLRGLAAGSAELQATRRDQSIIRIPDVPIVGQPVSAVVT